MPENFRRKPTKDRLGIKEPLHADYHDDVTDDQLDRIKTIVDQKKLAKAKPTSEPAW